MNSKRDIVNHTSSHRRISNVLEDSGPKNHIDKEAIIQTPKCNDMQN